MAIKLIYAATKDRVIGKGNTLPFNMPNDLKRFQELTTDSVVVMGSNTYYSIPAKKRPLKKRVNVVLSRNSSLRIHGVKMMHSIEEVLGTYALTEDIYFIGGGEVLEQAIQFADEIFLTLVKNDIKGDIYGPVINEDDWFLDSLTDVMSENGFNYQYAHYVRK